MPRGVPLPKKTKLDLFVDAYLDLEPAERAAAGAVMRGIDRSEARYGRAKPVPIPAVASEELFEDLGERAAEERT